MVLSLSQTSNIERLQSMFDAGLLKTSEIKSIKRKQYSGKVFDIQVSVTNSYQLENIFSSNSVGGSLVCFLLGITSINSVIWGLSFDRFLSPARGGYMLNMDMGKALGKK